MIQGHIQRLRRDYSGEPLDESGVERDPLLQFEKWMEDAFRAEVPDPHAMALATVSSDGSPSVRIVLLRGFDHSGFVFFTNYHSRKAKDLTNRPVAGMSFLWHELDRQVRIEGVVEKVSSTESDAYFATRPRDSKIAAWASNQSNEIRDRAELDRLFSEFDKRFSGSDVPRPENWGGFRIKPKSYEFWQGRPSRLHDRVLYTLGKDGNWDIRRLAP
ncbi:MAG: pyridoxamine 5'-phosphate oxidase [Bacteroidetes bacterium]|nr:pyridoxamine 5'-phosphate oxidase [Bacteroidota bacterium]